MAGDVIAQRAFQATEIFGLLGKAYFLARLSVAEYRFRNIGTRLRPIFIKRHQQTRRADANRFGDGANVMLLVK